MTEQPNDSILAKIRALLALADDTRTPVHEADSARNMAEAMMFKYRIDLATAGEKVPQSRQEPMWRTFELCDWNSEFMKHYHSLFFTVMRHCDLEYEPAYERGMLACHAVGFPADLEYFELLLTSALLVFGGKLEPKWSAEKSLEENIYAMRSAGMERGRIARLAWPDKFAGKSLDHVDKPLNIRVSKIFQREAERRREDTSGLLGRGNNVKTYRASYAESFVDQLYMRLLRLRAVRGRHTGEMVLADQHKRVKEALYERFPSRRPAPPQPGGSFRDPREDCPKCKQAKSGYCREHGHLRPKKHEERPWSEAGRERGALAADHVDLGGTGGRPAADAPCASYAVEG